jgi:hypothetical protein
MSASKTDGLSSFNLAKIVFVSHRSLLVVGGACRTPADIQRCSGPRACALRQSTCARTTRALLGEFAGLIEDELAAV